MLNGHVKVPHLADAEEDWYGALFKDVDVGTGWRSRVIFWMQGTLALSPSRNWIVLAGLLVGGFFLMLLKCVMECQMLVLCWMSHGMSTILIHSNSRMDPKPAYVGSVDGAVP